MQFLQDKSARLLPEIKDLLLDGAVRYYGENASFRRAENDDAPPGIQEFLPADRPAAVRLLLDYELATCAGYNGLDEEICFCLRPKHADSDASGYVFAVYATENGAFAVSPLVVNTSDCRLSKPWWDGAGFSRQPGAKTLESQLSYARLMNDFIV